MASRVAAAALALLAACNTAQPRAVVATPAVPFSGVPSPDSLRARADLSRIAGDPAAPLWLVVASDFQCPYCAQWHRDSYAALRTDYVRTGKVRMAYVNLPLDQHRHARPAASAVLCAGAQDRFWQMHDAVFETQQRWAPLADATLLFDSLAVATGADTTAWRSCMSNGVMDSLVLADRARVIALGVQSTPTFLISYTRSPASPGQMLRGAAPLAEFRRVLDSMLTVGGR